MTLTLQIVLILASILTFIMVIRRIRKSQMNIADSIIWIIGSLFLILISFFSEIMDYLAVKLGFYSTVNFVFILFIFILLVIVFNLSAKVSVLNEKVKNLNHAIALKEKEREDDGEE